MDDLISKIKKGKFKPLEHVSEECKDLLNQMICVDRKKRITAREILKHPWIVTNVNIERVDHQNLKHEG